MKIIIIIIIITIIIPSDENTSFKVSKKLSKYKDLEIEITRMWQMKTETILVVVGALGGRDQERRRGACQRNSRKRQPLGNSKDSISGNGTYSTEGPILQ